MRLGALILSATAALMLCGAAQAQRGTPSGTVGVCPHYPVYNPTQYYPYYPSNAIGYRTGYYFTPRRPKRYTNPWMSQSRYPYFLGYRGQGDDTTDFIYY